jgi:hypothetical protein
MMEEYLPTMLSPPHNGGARSTITTLMRISTREEEGMHDQSLWELNFRVSPLFHS